VGPLIGEGRGAVQRPASPFSALPAATGSASRCWCR
jgi:hypothetical protein